MLFVSILLLVVGSILMVWGSNTEQNRYLYLSVVGLIWLATGLVGVFFSLV